MTVELIKPAPRKFHGKCRRCLSEFKYELEDLKNNYRLGQECVNCPECGTSVPHRAVVF